MLLDSAGVGKVGSTTRPSLPSIAKPRSRSEANALPKPANWVRHSLTSFLGVGRRPENFAILHTRFDYKRQVRGSARLLVTASASVFGCWSSVGLGAVHTRGRPAVGFRITMITSAFFRDVVVPLRSSIPHVPNKASCNWNSPVPPECTQCKKACHVTPVAWPGKSSYAAWLRN